MQILFLYVYTACLHVGIGKKTLVLEFAAGNEEFYLVSAIEN